MELFSIRPIRGVRVTVNHFSRRQFLKAGGIGMLGTFVSRASARSNQARELTLYVGTYTSGKSEGIYGYRMDANTGKLTRFNSFKSVNPSFLAIDQSKRYLYAVNEVSDHAGKPSGGVSAFAIDRAAGNLRLLNEQPSLGADPCHLTINRKKNALLVANYTGGNVSVLSVRPDGTLGPSTDVENHEGSSVKEQQKGPHAHCVILDRTERYALAADLGIDKVMIYRFNPSTGKLVPGKQPWLQLKAGAGPRHLTLHPNGKWTYVINELDSTLTTLQYNGVNGTLSEIETVSTLPSDFSGVSYCADVHVSPSGRFVYGSNRGHNSIVVFQINPRTGKLTPIQHVSTEGNWPRNFTIDPTGKFLLVANQRTDNVVTLSIDSRTGQLMPTGHVEEIPVPVCVKFL
jgi:6-phosphogluconolactonase